MKMKPKPGPQPDGGYVLDCSHKIDYGAHPMPKKASKSKLRPDMAETAHRTMLEATGQTPKTRPGEGSKNPEAVEKGRAGGLKGGKARAESMAAEQRSEIAKKAAAERWRQPDQS